MIPQVAMATRVVKCCSVQSVARLQGGLGHIDWDLFQSSFCDNSGFVEIGT